LALVSLSLAACALAALGQAPPKAPDARIAGAPRPGWPYLKHPVCRTKSHGLFGLHHSITVSGVEDIPQMCNFLWAGLNKFNGCKLLTRASCGGTDGYLQWRFQRWFTCGVGKVASAWYDSTENRLGVLDCAGEQPETQPETQ
ncbi:hypothetical protein LZ30DRAFT_555953, partial [Colletotrichum cereale]